MGMSIKSPFHLRVTTEELVEKDYEFKLMFCTLSALFYMINYLVTSNK